MGITQVHVCDWCQTEATKSPILSIEGMSIFRRMFTSHYHNVSLCSVKCVQEFFKKEMAKP